MAKVNKQEQALLAKQRANEAAAQASKPSDKKKPVGFKKDSVQTIPETAEKKPAAKGRNFNDHNYYEDRKEDYEKMFEVIKSQPGIQEELNKKTFGMADININSIIENFRLHGWQADRDRLRAIMYGGYAKFPAKIRQDYVLVKFIGAHRASKSAKGVKAHILDTDYVQYVTNKGYMCRPQAEIEKALDELKVPHNKWQEYFEQGYVNGLVSGMTVKQEVREKFSRGEISREEYLDPKNIIGFSVASSLNGKPLKFYLDSTLNDLNLMSGVKDSKGNVVGYTFKQNGTEYKFGRKELEMIAQGEDVTLVADGGKTVTVHYSPLDGGIVPSGTIGKALKEAKYVAQERSRAAEQEQEQSEEEIHNQEVTPEEEAAMGLGQ